jgi:hypothetical protein
LNLKLVQKKIQIATFIIEFSGIVVRFCFKRGGSIGSYEYHTLDSSSAINTMADLSLIVVLVWHLVPGQAIDHLTGTATCVILKVSQAFALK